MRACCPRPLQGLAQACAESAAFLLTDTAAAAAGVASGTATANSAREVRSHAVPVAAAVADTAAWHGLASLLIPGVLINRIVWASGCVLATCPHLLPWRQVARAAPSVAGMSMLVLVPQIDAAVTALFDGHVRPRLGTAWLGHSHTA